MQDVIEPQEHVSVPPKKKKVMQEFQILRNGVRFKKIKAASFEEAKGDARKKFEKDKDGYFEIMTADRRMIPLFL